MPRKNALTEKTHRLKQEGSLNPHPDQVNDPLFTDSDFFDPHDLVQVKYEMVRRVQVDAQSVTQTAQTFGFSRPSFYQAQAAVQRGGLSALLRKNPGPQRAHKLDAEVVSFLHQCRRDDPDVRTSALAVRTHKRFGITVHPRSIERALTKQKKKRP